MRKSQIYYIKDNTKISCLTISYKYNSGSYSKFRKIAFWFSLICTVVFGILTILFEHTVLSTIFSVLVGGSLSIIIELSLTFISDKTIRELNKIEDAISQIDEYLEYIDKGIKIVNEKEYSIINLSKENPFYKANTLIDICSELNKNTCFNCDNLKFSWEGKDYSVKDFGSHLSNILFNNKVQITERIIRMIDWNYNLIIAELKNLRDKLKRCKIYITRQNPPCLFENINK